MGSNNQETNQQGSVQAVTAERVWQKKLREHTTIAKESWQYIWRKPFSNLLSWLTLAVILSLPGLIIWLLLHTQPLTAQLDNQRLISAFLQLDTSDSQAQALITSLSEWDGIEAIDFISAKQGKELFSQTTGLEDIFDSLSYNPLPATLLITPTSFQADNLTVLTKKLMAQDLIQEVIMNKQWLDKLQSLFKVSQGITWILGTLMTLGIVLVVSNTTHMQIRNNQEEINVIQIMGGTDAYLLKPFLYRALWAGLLTGLLACFIIMVLLAFINPSLTAVGNSFNVSLALTNISFKAVISLIFISCLLNLTSTLVTAMYYLGRLRI